MVQLKLSMSPRCPLFRGSPFELHKPVVNGSLYATMPDVLHWKSVDVVIRLLKRSTRFKVWCPILFETLFLQVYIENLQRWWEGSPPSVRSGGWCQPLPPPPVPQWLSCDHETRPRGEETGRTRTEHLESGERWGVIKSRKIGKGGLIS